MTDPSSPLGHNGGPPLDEDEGPPVPRHCKYCRHWSPPSDWEVRAYEAFQLGISRRRVKRPTGFCDRVLMRPGKPLAFSATTDTFGCLNFSAKPREPLTRGHGFVRIYEGDHIVWQGWEKDLPDEYR
ncbi:hypothetical protein [Sphingobium lactosutens]|uniref:Uncharacterized protein n=1 Tax=Sphingobium lactosutens DS20 TaxID=1331060 RepID=T0H4T3_9SPHN|nr:hypothetical protein [Sphingobium lactosutens]EQB11316.1 hypothetical protein RLDS_23220 [Sphingobium lactosutens DS20]